jgi:lipopolysaccharide transport system permease protein
LKPDIMEVNPVETLVASAPVAASTVAAATARRPHLTIRPAKAWVALDLAEMWKFRDLMFALAVRDIKLRYKQTALGVIWVILQPLLGAGILAFVFGSVAHLSSGPIPYFLFTYVGTMGWGLFNNILTKAGGSLVGNTNLISKVFFPRLLLPLSALPTSLLDFAIALVVMTVLLATNHITPGLGILLLPMWIAILTMYAMGIGLVVTSLMVSYRDVAYMMPLAVQILFYACPIAYMADHVPKKALIWYNLNPLAGVFEGITWSVFNVGALDWGKALYAAVSGAAVLLFGAIAFKQMEKKFADII